jgi:prepilin peptidase CpaA
VDFAIQVVLAATVLTAAITDIIGQRVPNWLTMPATVLALCLQSAIGGTEAVLWGVAGWAAGLALLIGFYVQGGMGAGDVKLMATVGAFTGPYRVLWICAYTALFGGVYALGIVVYSMVTRSGWAATGRRLRAEGTSLLLSGGDVQPLAASLRTYPKLRYAIVMALGVAAEQVFGAPQF